MALTSLAELRCCVVPLYDASGGKAARLYAPRPSLPYHTSAPLAAMLECISLPLRTQRPRASLTSLCHAVGIHPATPLAAATLALPPPPDASPPSASASPPPTSASASGISERDWFVGLAPLQLAPRNVTAMGQFLSVLGQPSGAEARPKSPGLTSHGPTSPGLTSHGLTSHDLTSHGRTSPGLTSHDLTSPGLTSQPHAATLDPA